MHSKYLQVYPLSHPKGYVSNCHHFFTFFLKTEQFLFLDKVLESFKKILAVFFRQKYEEYGSVTFIPKKVKLGGLVPQDKKVNNIFKPANTSLLVSISS